MGAAAAVAVANTDIGEWRKINASQSKWNAIAWNRIKETRYVSSSVLLSSFAASINYVENRERTHARETHFTQWKNVKLFSLSLVTRVS